jgi:hypothetical protein
MSNKLFAIDISGSTSGSFYYNHVEQILKSMLEPSDIIIFWDDKSEIVSHQEAYFWISKRNGRGGTYPIVIAQEIVKSHLQVCEIILITDGEVSTSDIDKCDVFLLSHHILFTKCTCFIISKSSSVNLSVICPFSRNCPSTTTQLNSDTSFVNTAPIISVSPEDIDLLEQIDQINTFEELSSKYDSISRALTARVLGTTGDKKLHDQCVALQRRITKTFAPKDSHSIQFNSTIY